MAKIPWYWFLDSFFNFWPWWSNSRKKDRQWYINGWQNVQNFKKFAKHFETHLWITRFKICRYLWFWGCDVHSAKYWQQGGFQLLDFIITKLKSHMTCYNSMSLIGWNLVKDFFDKRNSTNKRSWFFNSACDF